MASWTVNPVMEWSKDGGSTWTKISDHGRSALNIDVERIESKSRMADGTLRKYVVAKKHNVSCSWDNFPSKATSFLANGQPGDWMENFHDTTDGEFLVRFRAGSDRDLSFTGTQGIIMTVMISDFSKTVEKRGPAFDLWTLDITLEEV